MESLVPYNQIDHPAMPKSRLNSLLIILMVTLLASGGALIFLKQIDAYHRQQIFIAEQAALPIHKTTSSKNTFKVKTFSSPEFGFIQDYAEFYEMSEISANEAFPVLSYEKGPKGYQKGYRFASSLSSVFCPVLEVLVYSTEEKTVTNWLNANTDIKRAFAKLSTENINETEFIKLTGPGGDMVPSQVYLALANKNLYQLNLNFGLKDDGVDPKCGNILSGFKLTNETSAEWKTYRNEEYGFSFEYPRNWKFQIVDSDTLFSVEILNEKNGVSIDIAGEVMPGIFMNVYKDAFDGNIDKFATNREIAQVSKKSVATVNGFPGYWLEGATPPASYSAVVVFHEQYVFEFYYGGFVDLGREKELKNFFDKFISSFKFTK